MRCPACQSENDETAPACFECGAALAAIVKGTVIAERYEVLKPLGKGGMGVVYLAHDRQLDEIVALKVLRTELGQSSEMAQRFRSEIKLARRVAHKNVCRIFEYGQDGSRQYIAMAYVDGVDLKRLLREQGPLPPPEAFEVALRVAEALEAIHDEGIVHRDLKTPNIMRDVKGVVRVMDFGIARDQDATSTPSLTGTGHLVGSPDYMSPEQWHGRKADARSDIYALGIVVYELFTGELPFKADSVPALMRLHLQEPPPLEMGLARRVPPSLRAVLERALAKDPDARFQTAREMAEALRRAQTDGPASEAPTPVATVVPTPVPTVRQAGAGAGATRRRSLIWAGAILALALLLLGGGLAALWTAQRAPSPTDSRSGAQISYGDGNGFEFDWPADDYWTLHRGQERVDSYKGTAGAEVPPGTYRIAPMNDAVFEPIEFSVSQHRKTIVKGASGTFDFPWPADDYWYLHRGQKQVAMLKGAVERVVAPGSYRISPSNDAVFEPVTFTVIEGQKTRVPVPSGSFEFRWPAEDYWYVHRGPRQVAMMKGSVERNVMAGSYRISPSNDAVFEPVTFTVAEGQKTQVNQPSGSFQFDWPAGDYWYLHRGQKQVAMMKGAAERIVAPGSYRISPTNDAVFEPVEFTIAEGQTTRVAAPSGSFEFLWPGEDYWYLHRGSKQVAMMKGTVERVVAPGSYRIAPSNGTPFKPVEFTVADGQKTTVRPRK